MMMLIALEIVGGVMLLACWQLVGLPYVRLAIRRRQSRKHIPQAGEIWIQPGAMLYVEAVGPIGVEVMAVDEETKAVSKWRDDWQQWQQRLSVNGAYFSGQSRPLEMPQ